MRKEVVAQRRVGGSEQPRSPCTTCMIVFACVRQVEEKTGVHEGIRVVVLRHRWNDRSPARWVQARSRSGVTKNQPRVDQGVHKAQLEQGCGIDAAAAGRISEGTSYTPALVHVWVGCCAIDPLPSPKSHFQVSGVHATL